MLGINLAVLFVQYDTLKYPRSFEKMKALVDRIRFCKKTYFIIDNRNEGDYAEKISNDTYKIGGGNDDWEFSGWQKGISKLKELDIYYGMILFVNDSFLAPGPIFLRDYGTKSLLKSYLFNSFVGRIDSTPLQCSILGKDTSEWICTNCFFMPKQIMDSLGDVVTINEKTIDSFSDREFHGEVFRKEAPLNNECRKFIIEWLTHRRRIKMEINKEMWGTFRQKVKAMLNEALLTARVKEEGFKIRSYGKKKYY